MSFLFNFEAPEDVESVKDENASGKEKVSDARLVAETDKGLSELEKLAYEDQGHYEMEFVEKSQEKEESALLRRKKNCRKDLTHEDFIPVSKFRVEHLPARYQDVLLFKFFKGMGNTSVRIVVDYTSKSRPPGYPNHKLGGKKGLKRYGSGIVWEIKMQGSFASKYNEKCPCNECGQSLTPKTGWAELIVYTAHHVVYDEEECQHTICDLWFDEDRQRGRCHVLRNFVVSTISPEIDSIHMKCVSHNWEVCSRLDEMVTDRSDLHREIQWKYLEQAHEPHDLVMLCSHPHGMSKQISIGHKHPNEKPSGGSLYTASTCAGSSGAMVVIMQGDKFLYFVNHSGGYKKGENYNGGPTSFVMNHILSPNWLVSMVSRNTSASSHSSTVSDNALLSNNPSISPFLPSVFDCFNSGPRN